jgi:hypothetical protein
VNGTDEPLGVVYPFDRVEKDGLVTIVEAILYRVEKLGGAPANAGLLLK